MRNFFLSMVAFVTILSFSGCADSSGSQELNGKENQNSSNISLKDIGKTIPVGMEKENGVYKISLIVTAQFYEIKASKENEKYIDLIRQAVKDELPIHIYTVANTHEIGKGRGSN
ncbi:hypothetical protein [Chryseobacterium piperi]|uniref:hypothetical protein n=1 Tax=Chryseobacterium piperi TaxID=558152 RepID=UPI000A553163|nr:hypothetical protein [Chryseobacterium piperi]